jgi:hypothetical protein
MTYRDRVLALAAQWKFGAEAGHVLALLPDGRRAGMAEWPATADPLATLTQLAAKEATRVEAWGRKRWGAAWDRLDPRVRAHLVKEHGRDH